MWVALKRASVFGGDNEA